MTAIDATGNGHAGTNTNADLGYEGISGNSYYFNGSDSWIRVEDHADLNPGTGDFAVSAWIKTGDIPSSGASVQIISKHNTAMNHDKDYGLMISSGDQVSCDTGVQGDGAAMAEMSNGDGTFERVCSSETIADNSWHYIVATRNSGDYQLWIDGNKVNSRSSSIDPSSSNYIAIGRYSYGNGLNYYSGLIDEMKIYKRALSGTEILAEYNAFCEGNSCNTPISPFPGTENWGMAISDQDIEGKYFVFGGLHNDDEPFSDNIYSFDATSGLWETMTATLPYAAWWGSSSNAALADNGKLYLVPAQGPTINNGWGTHKSVIEYDPETDTARETTAAYSGNIWAMCICAADNGYLYLFGGHNGSDQRWIYRLDPDAESLTYVGDMQMNTGSVDCVSGDEGLIYLWGSVFNDATVQFEVFDPSDETSALEPYTVEFSGGTPNAGGRQGRTSIKGLYGTIHIKDTDSTSGSWYDWNTNEGTITESNWSIPVPNRTSGTFVYGSFAYFLGGRDDITFDNEFASYRMPDRVGTVIYEDDFSGDLSNWTSYVGTWSIVDGKLKGYYSHSCGSSTCPQGSIVLNDPYNPTTAYYDIEVDSYLSEYTSTYRYNGARIQFWVSESERLKLYIGKGGENFGDVAVTETEAQARAWNGSTGTSVYSEYIDYSWDPSVPHHTLIEKRGNIYKLYFDGEFMFEYTDEFLSQEPNAVGFHTYGAFLWDNFKITEY